MLFILLLAAIHGYTILGDVELPSYRKRSESCRNRANLSACWIRGARDLHAGRIDGGLNMLEYPDDPIIAEIRAIRQSACGEIQ